MLKLATAAAVIKVNVNTEKNHAPQRSENFNIAHTDTWPYRNFLK